VRARSEEALIAIVTALPIELEAVVAHLGEVTGELGDHGTRYELGKFEGARVAVVETGAGNVDAAIETETAIARYNPRYLFFVGIAGGIKDVKVGDVVAATRIYSYESGKYGPSATGKEFLPRPKMGEASHFLVQLAHAVSRAGRWRDRLGDKSQQPDAHVGPLVAGEKVMTSVDAPEISLIRTTYSDALALEMEGFGVLRVAYSRENVRMIVVRGISDMLTGKTEAEAGGSQPRAAANAAAFVFQMIEVLLKDTLRIRDEDWQRLEELLVSRYPLGPTAGEIWNRAGGDLSVLDLGQNGKASWHSAIRRLRLGGGGQNITFAALLACAIEDYPNSPELTALAMSVAHVSE